jgi:peptidoglycan hydrolase-like protein with peptidoglycan-binding domain
MVAITQNGVFPAGSLATTYLYYPGTTNGRQIRADIAPYAEAMATAFLLEFGKPLEATDGARDYATQVQLKKEKGPYAATPGTSNHGWARAFDLDSNVSSFTSREHRWLRENAHRWGFVHPTWAHDGDPRNGMDEPWHWEFVGGGSSARRILRPRKGEIGLGHSGAKVREVQTLLNRQPGVSMKVDDDFGLRTAAAVFRVQERLGRTPTGRVSTALLRILRGDEKTSKPKPSKPKPTAPKPYVPTTRERVLDLQRAVHAEPDGRWGPDTDRRVEALSAASVRGGVTFPHGVKLAQNVVGAEMDGDWGPDSRRRHTDTVKRVQRALGIEDDGKYGDYTAGKITVLRRKARS